MPQENSNEMMGEDIVEQGSEELYERLAIEVDKGQEPLRIDKFLLNRVVNTSRNKIQRAIDNGMVLVNNQPIKANYKVKPGPDHFLLRH